MKLPLVYAESGYVDDVVKRQASECGFLDVFEAPLSFDQIT